MKLLLDTHSLLWSLLEPSQLNQAVSDELENPSNELWLSPISTWELLILVEKGRVRLNIEPARWIRSVLNKIPFKEAPFNYEVAIQSRQVQLPHQDPVDRFLVATARIFGLTLITADERLIASKEIPVLANN